MALDDEMRGVIDPEDQTIDAPSLDSMYELDVDEMQWRHKMEGISTEKLRQTRFVVDIYADDNSNGPVVSRREYLHRLSSLSAVGVPLPLYNMTPYHLMDVDRLDEEFRYISTYILERIGPEPTC